MALVCPETELSFLMFSNACFPLRWAPRVQNHAHMHMQVAPASRINFIDQLINGHSLRPVRPRPKDDLHELITFLQASPAS